MQSVHECATCWGGRHRVTVEIVSDPYYAALPVYLSEYQEFLVPLDDGASFALNPEFFAPATD